MQAWHNTASSNSSYGYTTSYGSISPDFIYHQGEKYEIQDFYTSTLFSTTYLTLKDNKMPKGDRMIIEVNGTVYTLVKQVEHNRYILKERIFQSDGTYTIKILSIK